MKSSTPTTLSIVALLAILAPVLSSQPPFGGVTDSQADRPAEIATTHGLPAFRDAVRRITPSVVNISTSRQVPTGLSSPLQLFGHGPLGDDLFQRFFSVPQPRQGLQQRSLGSGVIVSDDGYVLTNHHVVHGADAISVTLHDGREFDAELVGSDAATDVAVLAIAEDQRPDDLVAAELAVGADPQVGDWVLAVGNPFGLGHTVTHGILSAKGRTGVGVARYEDFLQTDAAVNPGNSGGPLVDLDGRVLGVNTAIASRSGGNMGIGFAIPATMAANVMDSLIDHGHMERGWLGVAIQDLDGDLAASFGYDGQGVLVAQVVEDGPADLAGVLAGDIIVSLDGRPMATADLLATHVATLAAGRTLRVELFRDGGLRTVEAVVESRGPQEDGAGGHRVDLGLTVRDLDPELVRRHDLAVAEGVFVSEVEPGSLAARLGVRPGDVVLSVGDERVVDVTGFERALDAQDPAQGVRLLLDRGGQRRFLLLRQGG